MAKIIKFPKKDKIFKKKSKTIESFTRQRSTQNFSYLCHTEWRVDRIGNIRIRCVENYALKRGKITEIILTPDNLEAIGEALQESRMR